VRIRFGYGLDLRIYGNYKNTERVLGIKTTSGLPERDVSFILMDPTPLQARTPVSIISCQVNHVTT
jgi:hypothetical protein